MSTDNNQPAKVSQVVLWILLFVAGLVYYFNCSPMHKRLTTGRFSGAPMPAPFEPSR